MKIYSIWAIRDGDDDTHTIRAFTKLKDAKKFVNHQKKLYEQLKELKYDIKEFDWDVRHYTNSNHPIKKEVRYNYCTKRFIDCLDYSEEVKRGIYIYCFRSNPQLPMTTIYSHIGYEVIELD